MNATAQSRRSASSAGVVFATVLLWVLFVVLDRYAPDGHSRMALAAACLLAAALWSWSAIVLFRSRGSGRALVAPIFLLATSVLWLYVVIPFVWLDATVYAHYARVRADAGNEGQWLALRFALVLIAVAVWIGERAAPVVLDPADVHRRFGRAPILVLGLAAGALYGARALAGIDMLSVLPLEIARQIYFTCPVVASLAIAVAALRVLSQTSGALVDFMLLSGALFGLMFDGAIKPIFFVIAASVAILTVVARSPLFLAVMAGIVLMTVIAFTYGRYYKASVAIMGHARAVVATVESKAVFRQWESVDCLTGIAQAHAEESNLAAWARALKVGLTPRVLWPDKPDISVTGRSVIRYCATALQDIENIGPAQSSSATLLGEPLILGGWSALAAAQVLLVAILGITSLAWISGGPVRAAMMLGLTPWLIDFDQHLIIYIANLTKATLVAVAVLLAVVGIKRARQWT
jgi:hypothetical protein